MQIAEARRRMCPFMARNQFSNYFESPESSLDTPDGGQQVKQNVSNGIVLCQTVKCMAWCTKNDDEGYCKLLT